MFPTEVDGTDNFAMALEDDLRSSPASNPNRFDGMNDAPSDPGYFTTGHGSLGKLDIPPRTLSFGYLPTPSLPIFVGPSHNFRGRDLDPEVRDDGTRGLSYLVTSPGDIVSSASSATAAPSFAEMLHKCSELDIFDHSLHDSQSSHFGTDTSTPTSKLCAVQQSLDTSASMISTVATRMLQAPVACSTVERTVDNISSVALLQHSIEQSSLVNDSQIEPALVALSVVLALKVIDVCDTLAAAEPPNRTSHHHSLFLKRLHLVIIQIRSALNVTQRHWDITKGAPPNDAINRATSIQRRIQSAMKDAFKLNLF